MSWEFPEPTLEAPVCQAVTFAQTQEPVYREISAALRRDDWGPHRKVWEWVYIVRVLELAGLLHPGKRGLGFGVGTEPLASAFAARGCFITATDVPSGESSEVWAASGQHASALSALNELGLCPPEQFAQRVEFQPLDMTRLPRFDGRYDFVWSSCVIEHVGGSEATARFLLDSMAALKPGGVAVHTTELCLVDVREPIECPGTTVFTRAWLTEMKARLEEAGHAVSPLNFDLGREPQDATIEWPPYPFVMPLKIALDNGVLTTSFGLTVRASL
ncbi:MAG TPA: class I SAM-dependent methyltransferase [Thermoanaerobaculia bacterium]|nr:class I SAM-dependent methyltransferase [Thermoanaerobaculia bacterium]